LSAVDSVSITPPVFVKFVMLVFSYAAVPVVELKSWATVDGELCSAACRAVVRRASA
jgi:hypothetical protein